MGGLALDIQHLNQWKLGTPIGAGEGILFLTYATLRSNRGDKGTRLQQILEWVGDDYDGMVVFDEAHEMAGVAGGEGRFGTKDGSDQGIAGVRLQNLLPRARVLYVSATGASDVNNLAYATRLGLWGPGTAFADRRTFVDSLRRGGIAAMELIARDLKMQGLYVARALSFAGVEYDILNHNLTPDQIEVYDAYADAWAIIHTAAAHYIRETGRSWIPSTGNRISLGVTSAIVDGRAFLQARRERVRDANTAQGTPVVFAGGRLTFRTDDDMKAFGDNLLRTLNAVRERVGDMYLVHGGDMKGIERIAASWAEQHGIQQVRFGLDRKLGDRAGFRRNEQMLSLQPRYVIAFQGNGVTERLVIDAKKAGIRVVDRRGPLGTPPAALNPQHDRKVA